MPSPFPGMNPYLERETIWKDFHDSFLMVIRNRLVPQVRPNYIVKLGEYLFIHEPPAEGRFLAGHGDVSLSQANRSLPDTDGAVAVLSPTKIRIPFVDIEEHVFLEIRDRENLNLVTVIEMLSPTNKKPGADRDHYLAKRALLTRSEAHFVEIDLLRAGRRLFASTDISAMLSNESKHIDYVILINRSWKRKEARTAFEVFPVSIGEALPCIPLPLREGQTEIPFDLQEAFQQAYEAGPYQLGALDYTEPPDPPLPPDLANWANECLRKAGMIA